MKYIYAVSEDNHGVVSYFSTEELAIEECKVICEEMYEEEWSEDFDSVNYEKIRLDESWM